MGVRAVTGEQIMMLCRKHGSDLDLDPIERESVYIWVELEDSQRLVNLTELGPKSIRRGADIEDHIFWQIVRKYFDAKR